MIFFRVSQNINIKATDGTLVNYFKFKEPSDMENETAYITTYIDFKDINNVFDKVDKEKYFTKKEKLSTLKVRIIYLWLKPTTTWIISVPNSRKKWRL